MIKNAASSLEYQIAFGLERLQSVYRHSLQKRATRHRLTALQVQILSILRRYPDGLTLNSLSRVMKLTPATLSDASGALEHKELLKKTSSSQDCRSVTLTLTPGGRKISASAADWPHTVSKIISPIKRDRKIILLTTLSGMIEELKKSGMIETARMCLFCNHFAGAHHGAEHICSLTRSPLNESHLKIDCGHFTDKEFSDQNRIAKKVRKEKERVS